MKTFRTDNLTLSGYTLLTFIYALFFGKLISYYGFSLKSIIFIILVLPIAIYYLFILRKRVITTRDFIESINILGKNRINWSEIDKIIFTKGRKLLILITSKSGKNIIIDDNTENFRELLNTIVKNVDKERLPKDYQERIANYKRSYLTVILIYVVAVILLMIFIKPYLP